jgi:hypothetical protein
MVQTDATGDLGQVDAHRAGWLVHQSLEEQGTLCALVVLGREGQRETPVWRLIERGSTNRQPSRTA